MSNEELTGTELAEKVIAEEKETQVKEPVKEVVKESKLTGSILKWLGDRGFGFIDSEGVSYFVHATSLLGGYKFPIVGEFVSFTAKKGDRGWVAVDVSLISADS